MKRVFLAAFVVTCAGCWPFDFDGALAACADGGNGCASDAGVVMDAGGTSDSGSTPSDSGSADSGVEDGGSPDGGHVASDAGPGCHEATIACLDFEDGGFDVPPWSIEKTSAPSVVASTVVLPDGGRALMIEYPTAASSQFKLALHLDASTPLLYLRAQVKWSRPHNDDVELIAIRSPANQNRNMGTSLSFDRNTHQQNLFVYSQADDGFHAAELPEPTAGDWHCISGTFVPTSNGSVSVAVDRGAALALSDAGPMTAAPLSIVTFGGFVANDAGTLALSFDDLAVSTQPLPCP
jgi:hypothetical protein